MSLTSGLNDIAVLSVTRQGVALMQRLEASLSARLTCYVTAKYAEGAPAHYVRFEGPMQPIVDAAWRKHEALIFIGAAGIAVRMIAPHVLDKRFDPGVVVMDIQGTFAIALCSGHLGGANELCHHIAHAVGAIPVVTTGTDVTGTLAPDVLAKQINADVENWDALKVVSGALVDGQRVGVLVEPGVMVPDLTQYQKKNVWITDDLDGFAAGVGVTHRVITTATPTLWLRPRNLVVGIGCNRGTDAAEIAAVLDTVLSTHGLSPLSVRNLATFVLKADEPGLRTFADTRGLRVEVFDADAINNAPDYPGKSETVFRHVGVYGVSEPAALLSAQATRLLIPKQKHGNVTIAVAKVGDRDTIRPPAPHARRMAQNKERVGLLMVHTGPGKGKSTAAFGMALRAIGHGYRVAVVQFIKGSRDYGELSTLEKLGISVVRAGEGFTWEVRSDERQRELAAWGLERAREALAASVDLLILDEINIVLGKGFLPVEALMGVLAARDPSVHVVCTGRNAPETLVEAADLVTQFELIKHPFQQGIRAQPGVEF